MDKREKKLHIKSAFWRFLGSYLLVFLIPFGAMMITYITAAGSIRQEILSSNENTLHQFFGSVDTLLNEMISNSIAISKSNEVYDYVAKESGTQRTASMGGYYLRQQLNNMKREYYDNIFVVFPQQNRIVCCDTSLDPELFYQNYYTEQTTKEAFFQSIEKVDRNMKPVLISIGEDSEDALLGIKYSFSASKIISGPCDGTVVILLSKEKLRSLFADLGNQDEAALLLFDREGKLLISSGLQGEELDMEGFIAGESLYYDSFQGKKYVMQVFASNAVKGSYVSAIPEQVFWKRLYRLHIIMGISMAACVILSIYVAWKLSNLNYSPIRDIVKSIEGKPGHKYEGQEYELTYIKEVLDDSLKEIDFLNRWKDTKKDTLRGSFLAGILLGREQPENSSEGEGEEDSFLAHHISLLSDSFGVLLIQVEEDQGSVFEEADRCEKEKLIQFVYANVLQELCMEKGQGFVVPLSGNRYACVLNFLEKTPQNEAIAFMQKCSEECSSFVEEHFKIKGICSVSDVHTGREGLHSCYKEAEEALEYSFLYQRHKSTILFTQIQNREFLFEITKREQCERLLKSFVKEEEEKKSAMEVLEELQRLMGLRKEASLDSYKCFQYYALILFRVLINDINASNLELEKEFDQRLLHAENIDALMEYLAEALKEMRRFYREGQENNTICDQVEKYLEKNFNQPDISLNQLGELYDISPYYLSRMFKEQKGIALPEYITKLKIDYAKNLLDQTGWNLEEIAEKSGFLSSSTFIKTFKKREGITPGGYRKLKGKA